MRGAFPPLFQNLSFEVMNRMFIMVAAVAMLAASCSGSGSKRTESDAMRKAPVASPDETVYVRLGATDGDTVTLHPLSGNRDLRLYAGGADTAGELREGDTLAVMSDMTQRRLSSFVNVSQLRGLWMKADGDGIRFAADGAASNIGASDITLRSWRISDGQLVINYIMSEGTDYTERGEVARIIRLDKDCLILGFRDAETQYSRSNGLITAH